MAGDRFTTQVNAATAPTHTGSGDQTNNFIQSAAASLKAADPRWVSRDYLDWLNPRFVPPPHFGEAQHRFENSGIVVVSGESGNGRRTAALMLLSNWRGEPETGTIRSLPDSIEELNETEDISSWEDGDRILADLSTADPSEYKPLQERLSSYRAKLREYRACLVVVVPAERLPLLLPEFDSLVVRVGSPSGMRVFQRYLRVEGITYTAEEIDAAELGRHVASCSMWDVAKLASIVLEAKRSQHGRGGFTEWCREAITALSDRDNEIVDNIKKLRDGGQRALLLSAGLLSGASADAVEYTAGILLTASGRPEEDPAFERPDLAERFRDLNLTREEGIVRFKGLAYDQAIRRYFWDNFPRLRDSFREAVARVVESGELQSPQSLELVSRFADQCLRTNRPNDLDQLAFRWALKESLLPFAARALECGLLAPRHARRFRRQIYGWVTGPEPDPWFGWVLVRVCADIMAQQYPEQAQIRLLHLSRHSSPLVSARAQDALCEQAERSRRFYRRLLDRLTLNGRRGWSDGETATFLKASDPEKLITRPRGQVAPLEDRRVRAGLSTCWAVLLAQRPRDEWMERLHTWLDQLNTAPMRKHFMNILIAAIRGDDRSSALLYLEVHARSSRQPTDSAKTFLQAIDAAQGITFTAQEGPDEHRQ
ncbi:hypothetical protein SAMN05216275_15820 [Streptosporangium canum]|uniref:Uncharacterized protein n=1 Tax=Streptosporangium canum TaxID=324952 RepID=A0A1I4F9S3_9ACTN|nr:hypothetical protein [Streptosporangium canum]SFL13627.1 hypothetical protein SAMN05216275_15820 [Streptosporangium canum]